MPLAAQALGHFLETEMPSLKREVPAGETRLGREGGGGLPEQNCQPPGRLPVHLALELVWLS